MRGRSAACLRGRRVLAMDRLDDCMRIRDAAEFLGVAPNTLRSWGRE